MPLGIVTDEDFESEFGTPKSGSIQSEPIIGEVLDKPTKGRAEGDTNVPDSLRQIIGEEAVINGRQAGLRLASDFGISSSSVSAYSKGATSTASYNTPAKSIIDHINKSRRRAIRKASKTMEASLSAISQDKLDYADAKDLSTIAKDMSVIIKNLEPPQSIESSDAKHPQFVIFAPQFRNEQSYEVIDVTATDGVTK